MTQNEAARTNGIHGYLAVLRHGPAVRPFVTAVIARLPIGMAGLGMIVLIEQVRGAYSIAGVVTGAFALGTAAGAPGWGRAMDRWGQPRVLLPTAIVSSMTLCCLALAATSGAGDGALIALAAVSGVTFPPISPAMRVAWRVIYAEPEWRRVGFALDASAVELIFVGGPLLLSVLAAWTPPQVPLLVTASLMAAGTLAYCSTAAARGWRPAASSHAPGQRGGRSALTAPGLAALLVVSLCMSVGFGQMDTAIVATAEKLLGSTDRLGFFFAAIAGGSTVGGLVYGSRRWGGDEFRRITMLLAAFAVALLPIPILVLTVERPSLWVLMPLMFLAGLTIAPTLIIFQNAIDHLAPAHRLTEAQALLSASMTTGSALGTAVAGFTVDHFSVPGGVFGAVAAIGVGTVICGVRAQRWRQRSD